MKLTRKTYTTRSEKVLDFVLGLVGWCVLNSVLYGLSWVVGSAVGNVGDTLLLVLLALPLLINIGALIVLGMTRRWIALGALAAFASLLVAALLLGLFIYAICFSTGTL